MARRSESYDRDRDERGRFTSDDDDEIGRSKSSWVECVTHPANNQDLRRPERGNGCRPNDGAGGFLVIPENC